MMRAAEFILKLRRFFKREKTRGLSILTVEATGLAGTLFFLAFLPDEELVTVIKVMAFLGFIGGLVASNNTARIYSGMATGKVLGDVAAEALTLLLCEQFAALLLAMVMINYGLGGIDKYSTLIVFALVIMSSCTATTAFARNDPHFFVFYNYTRAVSNVVRVLGVFWLVDVGRPDLILLCLALTYLLPFLMGLYFGLRKLSERNSAAHRPRIGVTVREFLIGIPTAGVRSFANSGIIFLAASALPADDARFFRALLVPKDIIARIYGATLPLIFDSMFQYRASIGAALLTILAGLVAGILSFELVSIWMSSETASIFPYLTLISGTMLVYLVTPFIWRLVSLNRGIVQSGIAIAASVPPLLMILSMTEMDINDYLWVMAAFYLGWLLITQALMIISIDKVE